MNANEAKNLSIISSAKVIDLKALHSQIREDAEKGSTHTCIVARSYEEKQALITYLTAINYKVTYEPSYSYSLQVSWE
jgi:hypothetical protein